MAPWFLSGPARLGALAGATSCLAVLAGQGTAETPALSLRAPGGPTAVFAPVGNPVWAAFRDPEAGRDWSIEGPGFALETADGRRAETGGRVSRCAAETSGIVLETDLPEVGVAVRRAFSFCADGRTLRVRTALRASGDPVALKRAVLLDVRVPGQQFRLMGPGFVSSPVFGEGLFAGVEHPSAQCRAAGDCFSLAQPAFLTLTGVWHDLPAAVFGSASPAEAALPGDEGLRRAFLRYLDTVRVRPRDLHVHYNDWWTAPVPSSETFVLGNIAALKRDLFDATGFFFDSYALDAGWSRPDSLWELDPDRFPRRFEPIVSALAAAGARPGLWVSPSSLYPFALDNRWLAEAGYETTPCGPPLERCACMARGGAYQTAFRNAVLAHAREARLAHVKFDGFVPRCDVAAHGHPVGEDSCLALAEGLIEVFDALRAQDPDIALEPTCFGYQPSPWWLLHVPFVIGPFGDDSPYGRCPAPEYLESMITARDIKNLEGRRQFLLPSDALQCFDIVMQCPGPFQNLAAMAVGRGRWFVSCYINPREMDPESWRFFAELMVWARSRREELREPVPIGGNPARREAYGYAFLNAGRHLLCVRNPWIEEATVALPDPPPGPGTLEVRLLYPRRALLARLPEGAGPPPVSLGPFETQFLEVLRSDEPPLGPTLPGSAPAVAWAPVAQPLVEEVLFAPDPPPFGPSWTSPDGDAERCVRFVAEGRLTLGGASSGQVCVLCEGDPSVSRNTCRVRSGGKELPVRVSGSEGGFGAAGEGRVEHWVWFLADVSNGEHELRVEVGGPALSGPVGVFLRGEVAVSHPAPPFDEGPAFPLYRPLARGWSRVLVPLASRDVQAMQGPPVARRIERIEGVFLDSLEWAEASAGWGETRRNRSIQGNPMMLGGRLFWRGIGAHARARIRYRLPEPFAAFCATIGKDQEVGGGSVVFAVEVDGREAFRSKVFRNDTPPEEVTVPLTGASELVLIVEDAGDGIGADHADWADARLLR